LHPARQKPVRRSQGCGGPRFAAYFQASGSCGVARTLGRPVFTALGQCSPPPGAVRVSTGASLAFTTYQVGKLFLVAIRPDGGLGLF